jgi:primase-polymerase (primpol)-like protein
VFRDAQNLTAANQADLYSKLSGKIDALEDTATSWFDNKTASVKQRRIALVDAAELSERVASFADDPEDSADLKVLAENLRYQANELLDLQQELANEEYSQRVGSTDLLFSHLMDESRTAARLDTDWDMFMAIEPREFTAAQGTIDPEELKIRALAFMDDATSGHGMSRKAKIELTSEFIARVSDINAIPDQNIQPEEENPVADDSALFF